jgi:hypothetical protein
VIYLAKKKHQIKIIKIKIKFKKREGGLFWIEDLN